LWGNFSSMAATRTKAAGKRPRGICRIRSSYWDLQ
jgi:hypothetical protein